MSIKFDHTGLEIAIIGIGCHVPGARGSKAFWKRITEGYHSNRSLSEEELVAKNASPDIINNEQFVNSVSTLENKNKFDHTFFNYTRDEAAQMNPEHRIFHECVWEALEDSGYYPGSFPGQIGLYASGGLDFNWKLYSKFVNAKYEISDFYLERISSKDYLSSLIAYKLNLNGAAYSFHTACSSSLVALHTACRGLLLGEVKMAIAGGVSINTPKQRGYVHDEGMILSKDGFCRPFDKDSDGTFNSEGAGAVVLKRLKDAIADGDYIYATIKGSAVNNDGNRKVGYTAPSIEGQAECIRMAQKFAKVSPKSISYIETHGTGTKLGDPIEIEALNTAFDNEKSHRCAIGSLKSNIGHLNTAAGIAGLIKTALALKNKQLPASLHFTEPNPNVNFEDGPFYVNSELKEWKRNGSEPLRAGVSSFGIGGTNVHVILEESPVSESAKGTNDPGLLTVSAKSEGSLSAYMDKLKAFVQNPDVSLNDLAHTLQTGRKPFKLRKAIAYTDREDLLNKLSEELPLMQSTHAKEKVFVNFVFPGAGSQYPNMGRELYQNIPVFRKEMDDSFEQLTKITGIDYKSIVFPDDASDVRINEMLHTQPSLFIFEHAMAKLIISLGVQPSCMIGHSIGEYSAACISGVLSYEDALRLVVKRGQLMHSLSGGGMVSVAATEDTVKKYTSNRINIAAINGPDQVVLSGDAEAIEELIVQLEADDENFVKLFADQAGHSYMMEAIMDEYAEALGRVEFNEPQIPFISNVSGELITTEQATSVEYWLTHMRQTVRFHDGIQKMSTGKRATIFLEVGPGHAMSGLIKQFRFAGEVPVILNSVQSVKETELGYLYFLRSLGQLWSNGVPIEFTRLYQSSPNKIPVPTYAFGQNEFPCEVDLFEEEAFWEQLNISPESRSGHSLKDWLYYPYWASRRATRGNTRNFEGRVFLIFVGDDKFSAELCQQLTITAKAVYRVQQGTQFARNDEYTFTINPSLTKDIETLASELKGLDREVTDVAYLWGQSKGQLLLEAGNAVFNDTYVSLTNILKGLSSIPVAQSLKINIITKNAYRVTGAEEVDVSQSLTLGLAHVIPQEFQIPCVNIDIDNSDKTTIVRVVSLLQREDVSDRVVAIRNGVDWIRDFERNTEEITEETKLKQKGTYLITGGLGKVGRVLINGLHEKYDARVIVLGRRALPDDFDPNERYAESWIQYVCSCHQNGFHVQYIQADVTDLNSLKIAFTNVVNEFGKLDGVIHAAGNMNFEDFQFIHDTTADQTIRVLEPKVKGIENLYEVLKDNQPGFVWITSSLATVIAGLSFGAYAAANLYLEHFLQEKAGELANWKCIGLSEMLFDEQRISAEKSSERSALVPEEIFRLFEWTSSVTDAPIIYETVLPLSKRIERAFSNQVNLQEVEDPGEVEVSKTVRPNLSNSYVAPETNLEKQLIAMVEEFFGMEGIGIEDGFFELGGDSLKAMVLLKRIKRDFEVTIPLKEFFGLKTMKNIAAEIDTRKWIGSDVQMKNEITI